MPVTSTAKTLDADDIANRIPHGRKMSLLHRVLNWDQQEILCTTRAHRCKQNPLREQGQLYTVTLVEFAAQAAAVHSSLLHAKKGDSGPAYLGAIRSLNLGAELIPEDAGELKIRASIELQNSDGAVYCFTVEEENGTLAKGKFILIRPTLK